MYDLSVIIPARNEYFLSRTVSDILKNRRGKTEVIVGLDGEWADPPLEDQEGLTVIYYPKSIGQRAIANRCVELSSAKYVMKIDAHCTVDEGFDVKMMEEMQDNYTMIPALYNLHGFDWVCVCGSRQYQGPSEQYKKCPDCGKERTKEIIWKPRIRRRSEFYRFDTTLHFQYWGGLKERYKKEEILVDSMSAQGSCFMLTRDKWWELNICDEKFGSWGQQGTEVACKTWLSGGRLVTNRKTWYSHLFRTQGGDFSFPYPQSGRQVENARKYSRELFMNNTWEKQIYPLSWIIEKFKPIPDWHDPQGKEVLDKVMQKGKEFNSIFNVKLNVGKTKAIVTVTDNQLDEKLAIACQKQLKKANLPIYNVSLKPMEFGTNIVLPLERGYITLFKQIVAGLQACKEDIVFLCDHDFLYHPSHFDFIPLKEDIFYYDMNIIKVRLSDGYAIHYDAWQAGMLCGYRKLLLEDYTKRLEWVEKNGWSTKLGFEPGTQKPQDRINEYGFDTWLSDKPTLDIRHGKNLTPTKLRPEDFRRGIKSCPNWKEFETVEGWGLLKGNMDKLLAKI